MSVFSFFLNPVYLIFFTFVIQTYPLYTRLLGPGTFGPSWNWNSNIYFPLSTFVNFLFHYSILINVF